MVKQNCALLILFVSGNNRQHYLLYNFNFVPIKYHYLHYKSKWGFLWTFWELRQMLNGLNIPSTFILPKEQKRYLQECTEVSVFIFPL